MHGRKFKFIVGILPSLPRKILLQNPVTKPPSRTVRFEEVAGGQLVQKMDEAEGQYPSAVELPAEEAVLEDGEVECL